MKKYLKILAAGLVISMAFTACGSSSGAKNESAPAASEAEQKNLKVALALVGVANDGGWNSQAYEGLLDLEKNHGCEISFTESINQPDIEEAIRNYAKNGYNLIFGHGFEFGEGLANVAKEYPDIYFAQTGGVIGSENIKNLTSAVFMGSELGYLMGQIAAKTTKTNKIGFVSTFELPTIVEEVEAFKAAVKHFNPAAVVDVVYTGSWTDVQKAKEAGKVLLEKDYDVLLGILNACDLGVIQATQEYNAATGKNAKHIGWSADWYSTGPDVVLTSAVQSVSSLMDIIYKSVKEPSTFKSSAEVYGIKDKAMFFGQWAEDIDPKVKEEVMEDFKKLESGELTRESIRKMVGLE